MPTYRYTQYGKPLVRCPECDADLIYDDSIELWLDDGYCESDFRSGLNEAGELQDSPEGDIAKSLHSTAYCATCCKQLVDMDGVEEVQLQ